MSEAPEAETARTNKLPVRMLAGSLKTKRIRGVKLADIIFIILFVVIVVALTAVLISKLTLRRDAAHAQIVSDKVIAALQHRNGAAVWALGTPKFRNTYSAAGLTDEFKHITVATLQPPKLDQRIIIDSNSGRTAFFIYKYTALKVPFYIRTAIVDKSGTWELTSISGNADESQLLVN